ncbi:MAG: hypothetical protein ACREEM_27285 [Blastocatellia bacterium]
MTPRGSARLKIWLVFAGIFLLGCITGAALNGFYRARTSSYDSGAMYQSKRQVMFEELRRDLDLSDEQAAGVLKALDETLNDYRGLRQEVRPRYEEVRQRAHARIRALLTAGQQQRFDAKMAEWDAKGEEKLKQYEQQKR